MTNASPQPEYAARRARLQERLADRGIDLYLATTPTDLRYLTGFDGIAALGPNPFTGGVSAALVVTADAAMFCLPQQDSGYLLEDGTLDRAPYQTFLELSPLYPRRAFVDGLLAALMALRVRGGRMGYQPESCPASLADAIQRRFPALTLQQHPEIVGLLRMRKSSAELEAVRRSVAVCDAAQATVREMASAGTTEADILAAIRSTVDRLAGQDVALIHEVTSGPRSGRIGFSASDRVLRDGDLLLTDIAPQVDGYWGDSCATQPVGRPTPEGAQMLRVAGEALELGTAMVKPGALTRDVDRVMREHIGAVFPPYHNSGGHGIGLDYHEPPRLVPGEELVLEEDMVIAMEPGIYLPDVAGVRLEHVVVVTSAGCDVLSRHVLAEG